MNDRFHNVRKTAYMVRVARRFRYHVATEKNPRGRIVRLPCVLCPLMEAIQQPSEAHHPDYSRPFVVVWVCESHHRQIDHGSIEVKSSWLCDYTSLVRTRRWKWVSGEFEMTEAAA